MAVRAAKVVLVFAVAFFYTLAVLNNVIDFGTNYEAVRHVMTMDATFRGSGQLWRAITAPSLHLASYLGIIAWEVATMVLCWWGGIRLVRSWSAPPAEFDRRKGVAIAGLTLSLAMWLVAFLAVGGEWFLMWQSRTWNAQDDAFRMFTVVGIVLLIVMQPDAAASAMPDATRSVRL